MASEVGRKKKNCGRELLSLGLYFSLVDQLATICTITKLLQSEGMNEQSWYGWWKNEDSSFFEINTPGDEILNNKNNFNYLRSVRTYKSFSYTIFTESDEKNSQAHPPQMYFSTMTAIAF